MLRKSFLLFAIALALLYLPSGALAQVADPGDTSDTCSIGFKPVVRGSKCSCEPVYTNGGSCRNVGGIGEGCNPGYVAAVTGSDETSCTCVLSDKPGACSVSYSPTKSPATTPGVVPTTPSGGGKGGIDFNYLQQQSGVKPGLDTLGGIVSAFVPYIFGLAGIVLFLYLIWGGFGIMTSRGDPKATSAAKDRITRAVIGFVIIFAAYWIVQVLGLVFGISQFKNVF